MNSRYFSSPLFFLALITAWPVDAQQPTKIPRVAYLGGGSVANEGPWLEAFLSGLRQLGYVRDKNIIVETRFAGGDFDQLQKLAAELVRMKVDVILAAGTQTALAAKNATRTLPIVMQVADPISTGLVASLARPGGNLTGVSDFHGDLVTKRLEILKEVAPSASRVAVLSNPVNPSCPLQMNLLAAVAPALKLTLIPTDTKSLEEIAPRLAAAKKQGAGALLVCGDRLFGTNRKVIFELSEKHRLPAIYSIKEFTDSGGLMSYGSSFPELYRRAATYVDKILKGTKPADLPVEQPKKFELIINLKAAKAIGLTIPPNVLARADKVIR